MSTIREIYRRIGSVKNIAQVTQAMQTVASSKMRWAQAAALNGRPYSEMSLQMLSHVLSQMTPAEMQQEPLLRTRPVRNIGLLLITSSRGLCGGYNHNVIEAARAFIAQQTAPVQLIIVGAKGRNYALRHNLKVIADFNGLPERPSPDDLRPIAHLLIDDFTSGILDQVWMCYTKYVNTLVQQPKVQVLLPMKLAAPANPAPACRYMLEPNRHTLLTPMLRRFTERQVYEAILESLASEHSARMIAMRGATENARHLINELSLSYNKARQESITMDLIDIIGGAAAMSKGSQQQN